MKLAVFGNELATKNEGERGVEDDCKFLVYIITYLLKPITEIRNAGRA